MASIGGASVQDDLVRGIISEAKLLTVDRLKRVLRSEGQLMSGIKSELQARLIAHIHDAERRKDQAHLSRIRDAIRGFPYNHQQPQPSNPYPSPYNNTPASSASPQYYNSPPARLPPVASITNSMPPATGFAMTPVTLKNSPFYTVQKQIGKTQELKAREQTRDTARLTINLDEDTTSRIQRDPNTKVFVFCAAESYESAWKPVDIAFPHHAELKVNQEDVKVNLKGLKNKPGSTRPVDITPFLRKRAGFPNVIELVYALTNKKFYLLVNLVEKHPIPTLVENLKRGKYLSRERVVKEMQSRAKDDDIVTVASNMSLKDPVQMTRIEIPCRSMGCKHNECFDAAVFLALQEQAPTWTCPVCSKPATWDALIFDQYVYFILQNTPQDTDQVTIEPDGSWHLLKTDVEESKNPFSNHRTGDNDGDDDDLVEISDLGGPRMAIRPRETTQSFMSQTPPAGGMDSSNTSSFTPSAASTSTPQPPFSQSRKRPREEVIDLTLSDDDDVPPVSRIKRPSLASQPSDLNNRPPGGPGPYRFTLPPPPIARTSSPANYYDHFNTRL